jgi:uncharacterized radical SAM superfamily protein
MARSVECFYPGDAFPAISVTGNQCALDCKHCLKKYLDGMIPATRPEDLVQVAEALAERGARGFLLSGGSDRAGRVRVAEFAEAIAEVKQTTDLMVNAHVGLTRRAELEELVRAGVDAFSTDLYGDAETISDVLGIRATPDDYFQVLKDLREIGARRVAPHICIGIHGGKLGGELKAIQRLAPLMPEALILISLMPTKGTAYAEVRPPDREMMVKVATLARQLLPDTKLLLGCMRSKLDRSSEADVVEAGVAGIVLPASATVERLTKSGYQIRKKATCCAMF